MANRAERRDRGARAAQAWLDAIVATRGHTSADIAADPFGWLARMEHCRSLWRRVPPFYRRDEQASLFRQLMEATEEVAAMEVMTVWRDRLGEFRDAPDDRKREVFRGVVAEMRGIRFEDRGMEANRARAVVHAEAAMELIGDPLVPDAVRVDPLLRLLDGSIQMRASRGSSR